MNPVLSIDQRTMKLSFLFLLLGCFVFIHVSSAEQPTAAEDKAADERFLAQNELGDLEAAVAVLDCPLTFAEAIKKLGGNDKLQWLHSTDRSYKTGRCFQQVFLVVTPHLKEKGYVIVFEGEAIEKGTSLVTRVLVGFRTPLGDIYFANLRDTSRILREKKKGESVK